MSETDVPECVFYVQALGNHFPTAKVKKNQILGLSCNMIRCFSPHSWNHADN